jgi:nucleotide-binding universal stress UspA family protein
MQTGRDRDWLYIVHVNTSKDKTKDNWKAPGPTIPDLDRALQGYSYDIVELSGDTAAHSIVNWVAESSIDVLVVSTGRSRRLPNPMQNRTTDYIAANSACATLVIHPKVLPSSP